MIVGVRVKPGAFKDQISRNEDGSYIIFVKEKAEDNRANIKVIKILAREFGVHFSRIKIKNPASRNKIIEIKER